MPLNYCEVGAVAYEGLFEELPKGSLSDIIVKRITDMIDGGQSDTAAPAGRENFEAAKNRSDVLQKYRDASDDEFRLYIIDLLDSMLQDNGDYIASDNAPY